MSMEFTGNIFLCVGMIQGNMSIYVYEDSPGTHWAKSFLKRTGSGCLDKMLIF